MHDQTREIKCLATCSRLPYMGERMGGNTIFFRKASISGGWKKTTDIIILFWVGVVVVVGHGGYQRLNILNSLIYQNMLQDKLTDIGKI